MIRNYRRRKAEEPRWHFDTLSPDLTRAGMRVRPVPVRASQEPLCEDCEKEAELFRHTNESANSLH